MNVFIDSDVILDVAGARKPFVDDSAKLLSLAEKLEVNGFTSALVFSNVCYVLRKIIGKEDTLDFLRKLEMILSVIPIEKSSVHSALYSGFTDFEDGIEHYSAVYSNMDCIVTRNVDDYKTSALPVYTPTEFLALVENVSQ